MSVWPKRRSTGFRGGSNMKTIVLKDDGEVRIELSQLDGRVYVHRGDAYLGNVRVVDCEEVKQLLNSETTGGIP